MKLNTIRPVIGIDNYQRSWGEETLAAVKKTVMFDSR